MEDLDQNNGDAEHDMWVDCRSTSLPEQTDKTITMTPTSMTTSITSMTGTDMNNKIRRNIWLALAIVSLVAIVDRAIRVFNGSLEW